MVFQYFYSNLYSPILIYSIKSYRYSASNGILPESIVNNITPALQISTIWSYYPEIKISGAENATVPV